MSNPNEAARTVLRWTHPLTGFPIRVFVYTPARDDEAFVLLVQAAVVPAVTLTGAWVWQQARIRRLYRRLRRGPELHTTNGRAGETRGGPTVLQSPLDPVEQTVAER